MTRFGRYETTEVLGRGGMAVVYRAVDTTTEREVAVKVLSSHLVAPGVDSTLQARFEREIKLAARLEHPHVAGVLDVGVEGEQPYIVMRLLKGGSLQDRLRLGPLSVAETVRIVQEVGSALDEAHRQGIVHRDIKPSNLLFDQQGNAYVSDFGVARLIDSPDPLTVSAGVVGTPAYMSPEQLKGLPLTGRSDQYALCLVAFQALTARLPFEGTTAQMILQHLQEPLPSVRRYHNGLSLGFERVLARAAAKDPAARYATCSEFAAALATAAAEAPPLAASVSGSALHTEPDMALATPLPPTRLPVMAAALAEARAVAAADLAAAPEPAAPAPRRSARRAWPVYALMLAALVVVISLGWQWLSAASPPVTATPPPPALTQTTPASPTSAPTNTADATAAASGFVTLDPEAVGLAVVALPPGLAAAAVYDAPQGTVIATVPDRSIVQVLRGREVTSDGVVWVEVKLLTGEHGWMVEGLLSDIRGASPTPEPDTAAASHTPPAAAATATSRAGVIHTANATDTAGAAVAGTATIPPSTGTSAPPPATLPPATHTSAPPTLTLAPPTPLPPTDTPPPPTTTPGVICNLLPSLCP